MPTQFNKFSKMNDTISLKFILGIAIVCNLTIFSSSEITIDIPLENELGKFCKECSTNNNLRNILFKKLYLGCKLQIFSIFLTELADDLIRITTNGQVKGERRINSLARSESYLAFHAIPYAEPPIANKRFMHPIPHSNWENIYDASNPNHKDKCCPQVREIFDNFRRTNLYFLL